MIEWHATKDTPAPKDRQILLCWERWYSPGNNPLISVGAWQGSYFTCQLMQAPSLRRLSVTPPTHWAEIPWPEDPTY